MSSPAASRVSTFSSRPFAMTVDAPERAARFAASTFDSIPPRRERAARAAGHRLERRVARLRGAHERRRRIAPRVRRVEARLVGEEHEDVGLDEIGDERAQRVVVAEADLVGRDRVVLVDDRNDGEREQREERRARVEIAAAVGEVVVRQQDLRRVQAELRERRFVGLHESHLADGRRRLQLVHRRRPRGPAEPLHALGDRARRDEHDVLARVLQLGDLRRPRGDGGGVEAASVVGDEARADLDHQAARARDRRASSAAVARPRARLGRRRGRRMRVEPLLDLEDELAAAFAVHRGHGEDRALPADTP